MGLIEFHADGFGIVPERYISMQSHSSIVSRLQWRRCRTVTSKLEINSETTRE